MIRNRTGWQILVIAGLLLGLLIVYSKFFNSSVQKDKKISEGSDQVVLNLETKGKEDAKLKIVVLSSYDCGWSRKYFDETIKPFIEKEIEKYDVSLRYDLVAFQDSPALLAAETAYCANDQGKFWEVNDILWKLGKEDVNTGLNRENIMKNLEKIKLNKGKFISCIDEHKYKEIILNRGLWYIGKYNQLGFPTTFFNDQEMKMLIQGEMQAVGAVSLKDFIININKELNIK